MRSILVVFICVAIAASTEGLVEPPKVELPKELQSCVDSTITLMQRQHVCYDLIMENMDDSDNNGFDECWDKLKKFMDDQDMNRMCQKAEEIMDEKQMEYAKYLVEMAAEALD